VRVRAWWVVAALLLACWIALPAGRALAANRGPSPSAGVEVDTAPLDSYLNALNRETTGYLPPLTMGTFLGLMFHRGHGVNLVDLASGLLRYFFAEVLAQTGLFGKLLVIGVAAAVLEHVSRSFESPEAARFAQAVAYLAVVAVALQSFAATTLYVRAAIHNVTGVMEALLPLLTTLSCDRRC
jgi:stage III sporulation protein AE